MINIHFLQCVFHYPINIFTAIISNYLQKMYYTLVLLLLVVRELLSQLSCQGQQKPHAIHHINLQALLCPYYLIESYGIIQRYLALAVQMGKEEHLFPVEEVDPS